MNRLTRLEREGFLTSLDRELARFFDEPNQESEVFQLAVACLGRALREGHVCVELALLAEQKWVTPSGELLPPLPSRAEFTSALERSSAVSRAIEGAPREARSPERRPLVLDGAGRLYFHRYFEHETRLADELARRLAAADEGESFDESRLEAYFPGTSADDAQRRAARVALERSFLVVSGGPGTGKTSTVVKILGLSIEEGRKRNGRTPEILLLAPTGKAAQRLGEAIEKAKGSLSIDPEIARAIGSTTSTIHRALGVRPDSGTRFFRDRENPLPADIVIVDEASMVDLALMRALVEALGPSARLVLLGDRHQLASVEAGSVLAELSTVLAERGEGLVELEKSYRFGADSGIFALSTAIRTADETALVAVLEGARSDVEFESLDGLPEASSELERTVVAGYRRLLRERSPEGAVRRLEDFRLLAAHRAGPYGVERLNETCRRWLVRAGMVPGTGEFYRGRQILITENDPSLELANGDLGVVWTDSRGVPSVYFGGRGGTLRRFSPAQLPRHETAFVLTIHKTQGSEYDEVALVLPDEASPLLSRELLYTGVTRARKKVVLFGTTSAVRRGVRRSVGRSAGLAARLRASRTPSP